MFPVIHVDGCRFPQSFVAVELKSKKVWNTTIRLRLTTEPLNSCNYWCNIWKLLRNGFKLKRTLRKWFMDTFLIGVMNIKIRRFVRQPQDLRDGLIRGGGRGGGPVGILRCKIFFCKCKVEIFFFYPMAGLFFFSVGELESTYRHCKEICEYVLIHRITFFSKKFLAVWSVKICEYSRTSMCDHLS